MTQVGGNAWTIALLLLGAGLFAVGGVVALRQSQRAPYFLLRRRELYLGWELLALSLGLLIAAAVILGFSLRAMEP